MQELVIVTGMSGAGKTIALKILEDLGFYCVDNLPIPLVEKFAQLAADGDTIRRAALGLDIRSGKELNQLDQVLKDWKAQGIRYRILFLDASDSTLIKRYKETRRAHPLAGRETVEMEDLAGQDFILMEESAPYAVRFQDALAGRQIQCRPFLKLQSAATARNLVERERFLSVLPLYTVQDAVRAGRLSILRVPQWNQTQSVQLALHRNKVMTPQIHGFLQELRQILEEALRDCLAAP